MSKQDLINGEDFCFCSDKDEAVVSYSTKLGKFSIWFNGKLVSNTKSFKLVLGKLDKLVKEYHLEA